MAKDSPTVPNGKVDVVPGKDIVELSLHCILIMRKHRLKMLHLLKIVLHSDITAKKKNNSFINL